jgi:hypothetical protein
LAERKQSEAELEEALRSLQTDYDAIVGASEPVPNRAFSKAQKRIGAGVLTYESSDGSQK